MCRIVGASEVAHEKADIQRRDQLRVGSECGELFQRKAKPVDSGVNVQAATSRLCGTRCLSGPLARVVDGCQDRAKVMPQVVGRLTRIEAVEHVDDRMGQMFAQGFAFGGARNKEDPAPRLPKRCCYRSDAKTIGISFDDTCTLGLANAPSQPNVVLRQGLEIDRNRRSGKVVGQRGTSFTPIMLHQAD